MSVEKGLISYTQEPLITSVLSHDKRIYLLKAMLLKCSEGVCFIFRGGTKCCNRLKHNKTASKDFVKVSGAKTNILLVFEN